MHAKIRSWEGKNKKYVRDQKIEYIQKNLKGKDPVCLTFPGAVATFEKLLIEKKITSASKIVGLQRLKKVRSHSGAEVLDVLLKSSPPLGAILPIEFKNLLPYWNGRRTTAPMGEYDFSVWATNYVALGKIPRVSLLDLDICSSFNKSFAKAFEELFRSDVLSDEGVLFINHQKGREPAGVDAFLEDNFPFCTHGPLRWEDKKRYFYIPKYYEKVAANKNLVLDKIIEYRDLNPTTNLASSMIQYFFRFGVKNPKSNLQNIFDEIIESKPETVSEYNGINYQRILS